MGIKVKICGITDTAAMKAAVEAGAAFTGFVFHEKSRNAITPDKAHELAQLVPPHVKKTGLFVNAGDDELRTIAALVPLDLIQLHGQETPRRVQQIRELTKLPVMMAIRLMTAENLNAVPLYAAVADRLLFDSRAPEGDASGGPIDWSLLQGRSFAKPWMLAGGLNAQNLTEAVKISGAKAVDVSSGVENSSGHKDPAKIREFLDIAKQL
jgi:phosphoribosylanthranilate isomerase